MKKAQGLSLNVIIIAALALIVLVVLVVIFTTQIGKFTLGVSKEGKAELAVFRVQYGECHPTATSEVTFDTAFSQAASPDAKELAKANFRDEISRCKGQVDKSICEGAGCAFGS
ncbi:hypothetical protein HYX14_01705 [Candidatus Woesearchaeota archaeon]|nr:hypothetical protein [Candidatus Woesearchaeota archaeon]